MEWGPLAFAVALIVAAYLYGCNRDQSGTTHYNSDGPSPNDEVLVSQALSRLIDSPANKVKRVAVGLNVNADLIVSATALLRELSVSPGAGRDHDALSTLEDLQESFSHFFEKGAAAERYFADGDVYRRILKAADRLENKEYSIGGNAALMAYKMAQLTDDVEILVVGPVGPKVQTMMPGKVSIRDTSLRSQDEVHLIMEYAQGERWGALITPIATRFITSNDVANANLDGLEVFASSIQDFRPDVVMFSGLHLLDSASGRTQEEKLSALATELAKLPAGLPVHLELASMANQDLVRLIAAKVLPGVHSLGLNEQELGLVSRANGGPHQDLAAEESGYLEIGQVADILHWLLTSPVGGQGSALPSRLTRVHFHSLTFHVVATLPGWTNSATSVGVGTHTASSQACGGAAIRPDKVALRIPAAFPLSVDHGPLRRTVVTFDPGEPVVTWRRGEVAFHLSPVLVCKQPGKTVGLGDAISATAMLYTRYQPL